jgi:hypothetical protein
MSLVARLLFPLVFARESPVSHTIGHVTFCGRVKCWMSRLQLKDSNHKESYEGTQLGQIKYIVNCTEQTTEGIQATYM